MHWHCLRGLHQDTNISPPGVSNKMPKSQQRRKVGWQSGEENGLR